MCCFDTLKRLKTRYKAVLFGALFWGILSNGMGVFNKYSYHDDINNLFRHQGSAVMGRWMLKVLDRCEDVIFGDLNYSLPLINGALAVLLIALATCVIVTLLDIEDNIVCFLLAGIMVVFPVITSMFGYLYTIHFYMFGMLLGIIGTYLVCKSYKWYFIVIGIVLMSCAIGVYQAFVPLNLSFMTIYFLLFLFNAENTSIKIISKKAFILMSSVISSLGLYFMMNNFFLNLSGESLTDYQGISSMGKSGINEYLHRIGDAYTLFFIPDKDAPYYMYPDNILWIYLLIIAFLIVLILMWNVRYMAISKIGAMCAFGTFLLIPVCVNFVFVMAGEQQTHALMVYAQCVPFIMLICLIKKYPYRFEKMRKCITAFAYSLILMLNIMYCRYDNKCYLKATYIQTEAISYFTTLITRIKSAEGYKDEYPVLYVNPGSISDKSLEKLEPLSEIQNAPYWDLNFYVNDFAWIRFMAVWCGYSPEYTTVQTEDCTDEYILKMASYPDDGSIQIINKTVVVKLGD